MSGSYRKFAIPLAVLACLPAAPAVALLPASYSFTTGAPDGLMATVSRPDGAGKSEVESADDFFITTTTSLDTATFTGLLTGDGSVSNVRVEIYRVFPLDSDTGRTLKVPTRANSPSDIQFLDADSADGSLKFTMSVVSATIDASNSVAQGGIHPLPGVTTGGNGALTGEEVTFDVSFTHGLLLPANHYFIVPQVEVSDPDGDFYWLSAARPTVGTPFPAGVNDLQSWIRDGAIDPDWLRVGTDIVGRGTFNAAFSLAGTTVVPEPSTWAMLMIAFGGLGIAGLRRTRRSKAAIQSFT